MRKVLRLPVVNATNTRISGTNTLPSSSGVIGIGVIGIMVIGRTTAATDKDARYVNCFKKTIKDEIGNSRRLCVKRSGLETLNTPQTGSIGNAILVWTGQGSGTKVISAFGGTNSSIYDSTTRLTTNAADTTAITGKATFISETVISSTATITIVSSDGTGWYYQDSGTVTKIADAQFPTAVGNFAHLDGYAFIMDATGALYNSDLNSITSWTSTGVINCTAYPDKGIGCIRWKDKIIGFGTESMEFFYNAGNAAGSPLTRIAHLAQKIGAVHAEAITSISDYVFFCGSTPQGGVSIYQIEGQQFPSISRISTPEIDAVLLLAGAGNIRLTAYRDFGLSFILVKASSTIYAYCIEEKFWWVWSSDLQYVKFAGVSVGSSQVVYALSDTSTSGKVFQINPQSRTFQDNGATFSATARLQTVDPGGGAFTVYEEAEIKANVEASTSNLSLVWSDNDYQTYSNPRSLDLSTNLPKTTRLGGTRKPRAFSMVHSSNTPMSIEELRLRVSVGE